MPERNFDRSVRQGAEGLAGALSNALNFTLRQQIENRVRQDAVERLQEERAFQEQRDEKQQQFRANLDQLAASRRAEEIRKNQDFTREQNRLDRENTQDLARIRQQSQAKSAANRQRELAINFYDTQRQTAQRELQVLLSSDNPLNSDPARVAELRRRLDIIDDTQARFVAGRDGNFIPLDFSEPEQPTLEEIFQGRIEDSGIGDRSEFPSEALDALPSDPNSVPREPGLFDQALDLLSKFRLPGPRG